MTESNGTKWLARVPLAVDAGMIVALLSLAYWVGTQAEALHTLNIEFAQLQGQSTATTLNVVTDIAALKVRGAAQDQASLDMRDYLGRRLDRIEQKLDEEQKHK